MLEMKEFSANEHNTIQHNATQHLIHKAPHIEKNILFHHAVFYEWPFSGHSPAGDITTCSDIGSRFKMAVMSQIVKL